MKNKKLAIIIMIIAVILFGIAIILKLRKSEEVQPKTEPSSVISEESIAEEAIPRPSPQAVQTATPSSMKQTAKPSLNAEKSEKEESESEKEEQELIRDAAAQILVYGGPWQHEDDGTLQLTFSDKSYSTSGFASEKKDVKYKIENVEFDKTSGDEQYAYSITLKTGETFRIAAYENDKYTLEVDDGMFHGLEGGASFIKTAQIMLGNHANENGMTDEEMNESGVTYLSRPGSDLQ